ncbi:MAG: pyridoxamine 5'-phosphate oxidase family protein [Pseudomonadota bacterium]
MSEALTLDDVQAAVGRLAAARDLKVIDHLDAHAQRWLAATNLFFVNFSGPQSVVATIGGGAAGLVRIHDEVNLEMDRLDLDAPDAAANASAFALLCVVPGMQETLRINGEVLPSDNSAEPASLLLRVRECYLHCGKALIRSDFWSSGDVEPRDATDVKGFCDDARWVALATTDAYQQADVSPKGDPAGALLKIVDDHICIPDRPGNRRIDGFRNILEQPAVALLALAPGSTQVLQVQGQAVISNAVDLTRCFMVAGKAPHLVTRVHAHSVSIYDSPALARAKPWAVVHDQPQFDAAKIFKAHIKLSKERGLGASLTRAAVALPGMMDRGLKSDYEKNLY